MMNLNRYFIETYAYDSFYYKKKFLEFLIENYDKLKELPYFPEILTPIGYGTETKPKTEPTNPSTIKLAIKVEYFATSLHIAESLFALMWAMEKDVNQLWKLLAKYEIRDLNNYVQAIVDYGVSEERIRNIFFIDLNLEAVKNKNPERYGNVMKTIEWIKKYLRKLAKWYLRDKRFYNSYKHGLRFIRGTADSNEELAKFYEEKKIDCVVYPIYSKSKNSIEPRILLFSYGRIKEIYKNNYDLMKNVVYTLRQIFKAREGKGKGVYITFFHDREINKLFPDISRKLKVDLKLK